MEEVPALGPFKGEADALATSSGRGDGLGQAPRPSLAPPERQPRSPPPAEAQRPDREQQERSRDQRPF
jgi:hypothetical protein